MKRYMLEGGFNLRKWESNDNYLREKIREHEECGVETSYSEGIDSGVLDYIGSSYKLGGD